MTIVRRLLAHQRFGLLLVLALLSRLLIPAGYMVAPAQAGTLPTIVVCSGTGPVTMKMAMPGHRDDKQQHDEAAGKHPCAFASASAAVDLAATLHPAPVRLVPATDRVAVERMAPRPGLGLAAPPPPKTGPPHSR